MYNKTNQGYGICGSRNIYSSHTRIGNWIEDSISSELLETRQRLRETNSAPSIANTTVTRQSYQDPALIRSSTPQPPIVGPTTLELKTKIKEGMPYSLIFEHNDQSLSPKDRFTSVNHHTYTLSSTVNPKLSSSAVSTSLSLRRKVEPCSSIITTVEKQSQGSLVFKATNPYDIKELDNLPELPNFRRTNDLTSQFRHI